MGDPRSSHRRLDGETVPIDDLFSNGANWPGDNFRLPVEEVANCHCEVIVTLPDPDGEADPVEAARRKRER